MNEIRKALDKATETIGFFASVIKSGESWTEQCEEAKVETLELLHAALLDRQEKL